MSRFLADFYSLYRPLYPASVYADLAVRLSRVATDRLPDLLDLACGTGHSTESLIRAGVDARITAVDPDPAMLAFARGNRFLAEHGVQWSEARAEALPMADESFDAVLIGSAFHWMDPVQAPSELARVLRPRGIVRVYEYQFPKASELPDLNEWIRRQFNLLWKAPSQKPRGDFKSVVTPIERAGFRSEGIKTHPMRLSLGSKDLQGLIVSQSRYLHFEETLESDVDRAKSRESLLSELDRALGGRPREFQFALQSATFTRSVDRRQ